MTGDLALLQIGHSITVAGQRRTCTGFAEDLSTKGKGFISLSI